MFQYDVWLPSESDKLYSVYDFIDGDFTLRKGKLNRKILMHAFLYCLARQMNFCVGWLVVLGLTAFWDSVSVYIGTSPRARERQERNDRREKKCPKKPNRQLLKTH